jgi:TonB family protein
MVAAAGLSLLAHAGLVVALTSRRHQPTTSELAPPTVTFDLQATTIEEPLPAPAAAPVPTRGRSSLRTAARRPPRAVTTIAPEAPSAPVASADEDDRADEEPSDEEPSPAPEPAVTAQAEPAAPPTKAPVIAPDTARALRVYDTYPMLLAQASLTRAEILVEVCVSDHGQVSDAVIAEGGMAAFDHTLRAAIRSWRYRPLVVNGAPTPFCHFMRIKYALN